jgi:hypothetical protein
MTQPANKRFVMEDKFNTELAAGLATKASLTGATFTGNVVVRNLTAQLSIDAVGNITSNDANLEAPVGSVNAGISVKGLSPNAITNTSTDHAMQAGPDTGFNVRLGQDGSGAVVQAVNNGAYSVLDINSLGGNVFVGSASTTTSVLGTFTPPRGFMLAQRFVYTSSPAAFTKATYPWLRAIKIICVGGGGGGGGAAITVAAQNAIGQAGAGGAYTETLITDIAGLASSVTLVVGAGGTAGGANTAGGQGGDTSFGALCVAKGGTLGGAGAATAVGAFGAGVSGVSTGNIGDVAIPGGASGVRHHAFAAQAVRPLPGISTISSMPQTAQTLVTTTLAGSVPGTNNYGVGGFPGVNAQSQATAIAGGVGAGGLMIVELYA